MRLFITISMTLLVGCAESSDVPESTTPPPSNAPPIVEQTEKQEIEKSQDEQLFTQFDADMKSFENLIAGFDSFNELVEALELSQSPTFYQSSFERLNLSPDAELPIRSAQRKSDHEVLIRGAGRTKNGDAVGFSVLVDETRESK